MITNLKPSWSGTCCQRDMTGVIGELGYDREPLMYLAG